jgi:hypothetical protein
MVVVQTVESVMEIVWFVEAVALLGTVAVVGTGIHVSLPISQRSGVATPLYPAM